MLPGEPSISDCSFSDTPEPPPMTAIQVRAYMAKTVRMTVKMEQRIKFTVRTDPQMK